MGFAGGPLVSLNSIAHPAPVLITATFEIMCADYNAVLRFRSNNSDALTITVIHETIGEAIVHDIIGAETSSVIAVQDRETLTVLVRGDEGVLACAVLEVDIAQAERIGAILVPRCTSNIILDHNEFIAARHFTGPLIENCEQASPDTEASIGVCEVL